jgi:type 1 glutamine amidotransferase
MRRKLQIINIALLAIWILPPVLFLTGTSKAQSPQKLREVSAGEIQKIEQAMPAKATVAPAKPRKVLVFWRCEGFFHTSIPVVNKALEIMGKKTGAFEVTLCTDDYSVFTPEKLKEFDAVCLNNTTRLKFDPKQAPERCKALIDFVKGGKAIVGIHAATDNFYDWPEAAEMMGGQFTGHPWGGGGTWAIKIDEPNHPLMAAFKGKGFKVKDEIYRTEPPLYSRSKQLVLMSLDMSDPDTRNVKDFKETDKDTGISWIKTCGKGRVFYCSLGHNDEILWNPAILQHYLDGIQFALGDFKVDTKPKP